MTLNHSLIIVAALSRGWSLSSYSSNNLFFFMSPYEFTSKTHSLSTEDLGIIFIDSFTMGTFYYKQKVSQKVLNNIQKMRRKWGKNMNDICCCNSIEGGVFRVQGPYLIIENKQKMTKNCLKIRIKWAKNLNVIFCCHDVRGTVFRVQGPYLKIENS